MVHGHCTYTSDEAFCNRVNESGEAMRYSHVRSFSTFLSNPPMSVP